MNNITVRVDNDETVIIVNENTTIGYATLDASAGELTYIFVHPAFRRRGYGSKLVAEAERVAGCQLKPADPISPLGRELFKVLSKI